MVRTWAIEPIDPAVGPDEEACTPAPGAPPAGRFGAWRRRSAIGGVATGVALGLQEIFYPTENKPVITAEAPGDPPDAGERMRVVLHPEDPTRSVAIFPSTPEVPPPPVDRHPPVD